MVKLLPTTYNVMPKRSSLLTINGVSKETAVFCPFSGIRSRKMRLPTAVSHIFKRGTVRDNMVKLLQLTMLSQNELLCLRYRIVFPNSTCMTMSYLRVATIDVYLFIVRNERQSTQVH